MWYHTPSVPDFFSSIIGLLLFFFFDMDHFFKNYYWICYNIASVLCFGFFWPWGMWDSSCPTRDQACTPCIGRQSLNHWTTKEVPSTRLLPWLSTSEGFLNGYHTLTFVKLFILCLHMAKSRTRLSDWAELNWLTASEQGCESFKWTAKHTNTCICSPLNSLPIQGATSHWGKFCVILIFLIKCNILEFF